MRRLAWLVCAALAATVAMGQNPVRQGLLGPLDQEMERAGREELRLLSPGNFEKAEKAYKKAQDDFRRGRKLDRIRKSITETEAALKLAFDSAGVTRATLTDLLALRGEVLQFPRLATKADFWKAHEGIKKAAEKIEKDDLKGARKHGKEAERRFRRAALDFLKKDILDGARKALKSSKNVVPREEHKAAEKRIKEIEKRIKKLKDKDPFSVTEVVGGIRDELTALFPDLATS